MDDINYELYQTNTYKVDEDTWNTSELWVDRETGESRVITKVVKTEIGGL